MANKEELWPENIGTTFASGRSNEYEIIITVLKTTLGSSLPQQCDWKVQIQEKYKNNHRDYTLYK